MPASSLLLLIKNVRMSQVPQAKTVISVFGNIIDGSINTGVTPFENR